MIEPNTFLPFLLYCDLVTGTPLDHLDLKKRIGCNVYIEMPSNGESVQFWDKRFTDEEYENAKRSDYGLDRELLVEPALEIRPKTPEVILFDASLPHAVEEIKGEGDKGKCRNFYSFARKLTSPLPGS